MTRTETITLRTGRFNSDGDEVVAYGPITISERAELPSQYGGTSWHTFSKTVYGAGLLMGDDERQGAPTPGPRVGIVREFATQDEAHQAAAAYECDTFGPFNADRA